MNLRALLVASLQYILHSFDLDVKLFPFVKIHIKKA